ncbi:ParB/RepB/Spo0J family partition protein [Sulfurimonas sp.]|uniref:ParB/RepB/Spo0J family partition protein n=1 Tax=Sulfurimonas sp. TaxID=2022749 RepID=UPI002625144E|nr:ParB/RepB/Spo0J family partition protein [Sulfurimonas sp.]MDD3450935.1 ParB/RepB/Spo0J family partition protein [Sulfurimonas sp.]
MNLDKINKATSGKTRTTGVSAFMELELTKIFPNPNQPRKNFQNIEELAQSIQAQGLIQPIAVVKKEDGYMVVSGERRYRACQYLELKSIKAHVLQADDVKVQELSLIENIQREDLSDFEKAKFIGQLWASGKYAQKQDLAVAIGKSSSYISKVFSSLKLDSSILNEIEENKNDISLSVLEEISRVKNKDTQREVYEKYIAGEITRDDIKIFKADNIKKDTKKTSKNKKYKHPVVEYKTITNIDEIISELKKAISSGAELDGNRVVGGGMDGTYLDNSYEVTLFELLKDFKDEIKELNKKEIYIISYQNKKTSHGGGGHRVRAYNEDEALELGREHYSEYAKDKNYIFEARTLRKNKEEISHGKEEKDKKCFVTSSRGINFPEWKDGFRNGLIFSTPHPLHVYGLDDNKNYKITIEEI